MTRPRPLDTSKRKVKTGCRTCKARRVKCDEGRPECHRCVSTGRSCEGYGIWGGGRCTAKAITPRAHTDTVQYALSSLFGELSPEQESCFQWFRYRTYTKLPLPFVTPFWSTLILQACTAEPAILHAALALGSAHQKETTEEGRPREECVVLDSQQKFMLQEYGEAIRSLQSHLLSHDKRSIHVALAACVIFTFFENLLGRYVAANAHLHSGLRLIAEVYGPPEPLDGETAIQISRGSVDDWIIETFSRLHVQAALWGQGLPKLYIGSPGLPNTPIPTSFESTNQAARHMDRLILDVLDLVEQYYLSDGGATPCTVYDERQQYLLNQLNLWLMAYNATNKEVDERFSIVDEFYLKLLGAYQTMAVIILKTCTSSACEVMYDLHTADFYTLLEQLVGIWKAHIARPAWRFHPPTADMPRKISHSVGDKGWIPLLYFLAVKCRVRRIRLQAIKLLSQTAHKEGIWDSRLALIVAKEIVRIEEDNDYEDMDREDRFSIISIPAEHEIAPPSVPEYRRLYNIHVGLPAHPQGVLTLEYKQRQANVYGVTRQIRCYDLQLRRWADVVDSPV
ncbi:hypothetical protein F5B22DRAFT_30745 [Xylaria bambusicola]|uniref:uncharacterized protein n=1 Tax=Xylaria bambusicola TaxID=326684 RepID=UPI0020083C9D|nr:uncharacterized protein F5B22DRAFT_30745 [Xylaria bambusicola]KAI0528306.1 hypothetical protein F5B22DRAFT_30745 [Xylaria bambusicola]